MNKEFAAQPEHEPFLFVRNSGISSNYVYEFTDCDDPIGFPVYTEQPDQSARIAELEKDNAITHENLAWYMAKYREHLTEIKELKQQLAALQAKREQLAWDELKRLSDECDIEWSSDTINFARAIEAAHGITGGEK